MKFFKKGTAVLLGTLIVLSCLTVFPVLAENPAFTYYYDEDYVKNYEPDETEIHVLKGSPDPKYLNAVNKGTVGDVYRYVDETGNGMLRMACKAAAGTSNVEINKIFTPAGKPKLVLEFRYRRLNPTATSSLAYHTEATGSPFCFIKKIEVTNEYGIYDKNGGTLLGTAPINEWNTIMVVYDNQEAKRTILLNGEIVGCDIPGNAYGTSGNFRLRMAGNIPSGGTSFIDIDYMKIYEYPAVRDAEIQNPENSEVQELGVRFSCIADLSTMEPGCFSLEGTDVAVTEVKQSVLNPYDFTLTLDKPLDYETEYTLSGVGLRDIDNLEIPWQKSFTTRKAYLYAEQMALTDGTDEIQWLQPGTFQYQANVKNETSGEETIALYAAYYSARNALKKLDTHTVSMAAGSEKAERTEVTVDSDIADGENLSLFAWKAEGLPIPVSSVVSYGNTEKTSSAYQMQVPAYEGTWEVSTQVDTDTSMITVAIDTKEPDVVREAAVLVRKQGKEGEAEAAPSFAAQKKTTDGKAEFVFQMEGEGGIYEVRSGVNGAADVQTDAIRYYTADYIQNGLERFSAAENAQTADELISEYQEPFGMDASAYDLLSQNGKATACEALIAMRGSLPEQKYQSVSQLNEIFGYACVLGKIYDKKDVGAILDGYHEIFGFDPAVYEVYSKVISDRAKTETQSRLGGVKYTVPETLAKDFTKQTILSGFSCSENYKQTKKLITSTDEQIGLSLTEYNRLKDTDPVDIGMTGKQFSDFTELKTKFDALVTQAKKEENSQSGSGGRPSSGGSSGGGTIVDFGPSATPKPVPTSSPEPADTPAFDDMQGYDWAQEAVNALYKKGVVKGQAEGKYVPQNLVTRAEFVKMLVLAFDLNNGEKEIPFEDVGENDWFRDYVAIAYHSGIVSGTDKTVFSPQEPLTREMAAAMLYKTAQRKGTSLNERSEQFADMNLVSGYAYDAVAALSAAGILSGYEDGTVRPQDFCDRAQAAQLVYQLMGIEGDEKDA